MLCRLPMALTQVKKGNISKRLLYEIIQIIYSLYQGKEITEKLYSNIMNSKKVWHKMDTIFMNSENDKISKPYRLLINLRDNINFKKVINMMLYKVLTCTTHKVLK